MLIERVRRHQIIINIKNRNRHFVSAARTAMSEFKFTGEILQWAKVLILFISEFSFLHTCADLPFHIGFYGILRITIEK